MSIMIPRVYDQSTPSPGEKNFFERISNDNKTTDWVILHSLNIAHHKTNIMGEIDFLVIIPKVGVLAVEIKAHRYISVDCGKWYMGRNDQHGTVRSPFVQVNQSMFSLKDYIRENYSPLQNIPIFPLVIFTHTEFSFKSIEWNSNQYVSCKEYRSQPISEVLLKRFKKIKKEYLTKSSTKWLQSNQERPNKKEVEKLVELLRPSLESPSEAVSLGDEINIDLVKFTAEQFGALDMMEDNSRLIFNGAAGTGKTFIAIESAIRAATKGYKVLFVCMNKLLSEMLRLAIDNENIKVTTLHALMRKYDPSPAEDTSQYWETDLPQVCYLNMLEQIKEDDFFDLLIMDEAQDIIGNELWLDCLDLLLTDGLSNGKWHIFGDLSYQSIYNHNMSKLDLLNNIKNRNVNNSIVTLRKNCRNVETSARLSMTLANIRSPYQSYLRNNKSIINSKIRVFVSEEEQLNILISIINKCFDAGFIESDIIILSKVAESKCISFKYQDKLSAKPYKSDVKGLRFTSIHKFKGLEAPIIILTDFDEIESDNSKTLLFTGASRATDSVHYIFHKNIEKYLTAQR
ncbi:MAG: ATP-binding domain-containing protein [Shewanella psychromarinicola]|uniref:nuclease-related domain-containing DEAD/DEAH box helicase n=1 Tax=Shewanella psychromarinicola TaxID=2487742 RepID=UPI0030026CD5